MKRTLSEQPVYPWLGCLRETEAARTMERRGAQYKELTLPIFAVHGDKDNIAPLPAVERFLDEVASTDKELATFPGAFHEVCSELSSHQPYHAAYVSALLRRPPTLNNSVCGCVLSAGARAREGGADTTGGPIRTAHLQVATVKYMRLLLHGLQPIICTSYLLYDIHTNTARCRDNTQALEVDEDVRPPGGLFSYATLFGVLMDADDSTRDTIIHVEAALARLFVLAQPVGARCARVERFPPRYLPARPPVPPFSAARRFAKMKILLNRCGRQAVWWVPPPGRNSERRGVAPSLGVNPADKCMVLHHHLTRRSRMTEGRQAVCSSRGGGGTV